MIMNRRRFDYNSNADFEFSGEETEKQNSTYSWRKKNRTGENLESVVVGPIEPLWGSFLL